MQPENARKYKVVYLSPKRGVRRPVRNAALFHIYYGQIMHDVFIHKCFILLTLIEPDLADAF